MVVFCILGRCIAHRNTLCVNNQNPMSEFKPNCKIYIIESQSDSDILIGRSEGKSLSSALELSNINCQYFQVINEDMLDKSFDLIIQDINQLKLKGLIIPFIHFSAHGNEDGIGLSNNDFLHWEVLRSKIDKINSEVGKFNLPDLDKLERSRLHLCFSVCNGFHASKIQGDYKENKYTLLIGPTKEVDWSDSLLAFTTLYHQIFHKGVKAVPAVRNMNLAAGLDNVFQLSPGYGNNFTE